MPDGGAMTRLKTGSLPLSHLQLQLGWNTALSCSHPAWLSSVIPSLKLPDISACWVLDCFFFYSFDMCSGLQYASVWVAVTVVIPRTIFLVNSSRKCFLFRIDLLFFLPLLFWLLNPAMLLTRLWVALGLHWLKGWGIELDEPFCFLDYIFQLRLPEC